MDQPSSANTNCRTTPKLSYPSVNQNKISRSQREKRSEADLWQTENELRKLCFKNPGRFMEDFDPERSEREMRKLKRRMCTEKVKKNQIYSDNGLLLETSEDLCDCLEMDCPGCHFPCPKCSSPKCGPKCRNNRCWYYDTVEIQGSDTVIRWPRQPTPYF